MIRNSIRKDINDNFQVKLQLPKNSRTLFSNGYCLTLFFSSQGITFHRTKQDENSLYSSPALSSNDFKSSYKYTTNENQMSSLKSSNRRTQLIWIAQSVEKTLVSETLVSPCDHSIIIQYQKNCSTLVNALSLLSRARTPTQVLEVGRKIELLLDNGFLYNQVSVDVQERVVKATAMAGLIQPVALSMMQHMISERFHVPSLVCQDSLFSSLRQAGRIATMESVLLQLGDLALSKNGMNSTDVSKVGSGTIRVGVSRTSFNIFLASLCDVVTNSIKHDTLATLADSTSISDDTKKLSNAEKLHHLDQAWQWIKSDIHRDDQIISLSTSIKAQKFLGVVPDIISYATVMQAAARYGNQTLVNIIWQELGKRSIVPNVVAYNARLRMESSAKNNLLPVTERDRRTLKVWHEMNEKNSRVRPDRYSIDLVLLPLIREGRLREVEAVIDEFIKRNSEKVASEAFAAFLITMVVGNQLPTARKLFDTFVLPTLSPVLVGSAGSMRMIRPTVRQFNVLIEGYRRIVSSKGIVSVNSAQSKHAFLMLNETAYQPAWKLFDLMTNSSFISPDDYTITSMMGLCRNSKELSILLWKAYAKFQIELRSVVLRATLTAYGTLGDASSALWIFLHFSSKSTRNWNVFLGALAKSLVFDNTMLLEPSKSEAAKCFETTIEIKNCHKQLLSILENSTIIDAIKIVLNVMSNITTVAGLDAPTANSQTYCIAATAFHQVTSDPTHALSMFKNATSRGIPADGRFVNAIFRCYGDDVNSALHDWKNEIRPRCISFVHNGRTSVDNLSAAYNGLLYVCGKARRPDIALRLVYAMKKEDLEPNELSLNSYKSGKREQNSAAGLALRIAQKLQLVSAYESVLEVECTKYDPYDRRRLGERRVRIIV